MPMDDRITLVPNEYYRNGTPKIDEIAVRTISERDTLALRLARWSRKTRQR